MADKGRRYLINKEFFNHWTNGMAWVLGLMWADGNICLNKNTGSSKRIRLYSNDIETLQKVKKIMKAFHPIKFHRNKCYMIDIGSKDIYFSLIKIGFKNRNKFPNVPQKYLSHFVRGFFDGDGSVYANGKYSIKISFYNQKDKFLLTLRDKIIEIGCRVSKVMWVEKANCFRLGTGDRKIVGWLYKNKGNNYMLRKFIKAQALGGFQVG